MQRDTLSVTDEDGASRATSVSAEDGTESPGPRKTLEEREIAYLEAKKRIYGPNNIDDDSISATASQPRSRQASRYGDDDDDPDVPRRTAVSEREIVYGSLSHPAAEASSSAPPMGPGPQGGPPSFNPAYDDGYQGMQQPYMPYQNPAMMGPDPNRQLGGPYPNQPYSAHMPMGPYGPPWQHMAGQMGGAATMQQMMGMMPPAGQGWYPPDMGVPPQQPHNMMSMMPIPQGMPMPYAPPMPYGPQQQMQQGRPYGPPLAHPTPMRPGLDPLSSTASSISSRSYQDVHSRPHSRGSTTSTRSAASSVRLGGMYPSGQQSYGYRQKAVKPSQGSFSSSIGRPTIDTRRSGRQSPVSPVERVRCFIADPRPRPPRRALHAAHPQYRSSSPNRGSTRCRRDPTGRRTTCPTTRRRCLQPAGASRARVTSHPCIAALSPGSGPSPCRSRRSRCDHPQARHGTALQAEAPSTATTRMAVRACPASMLSASTRTLSLLRIAAGRTQT